MSMDRQRFQRLRELVELALEQPEERRRAFVERECQGNAELLRDALGLLEIDGEVTGLLPDASVPGDEKPARAGRYRLLEELGRGGMGTVYAAERADREFEKRVAVKVMNSRLAEPRLVERFRAERQILANLEHPYIARLLDGGTLDDGRPFLVMELIEGQVITYYCNERSLGVAERIRLFCTACEAVEHAHRNLVVHRDIKPSNLLIAEDGTPRLLDFGIAKLLEVDAMAPVALTATVHRAFTPEYASPEQIRGGQITTATDVYALGALLYELLTNERPYEFGTSSSLVDLEKSIMETPPAPPSARVGGEPQLARRLSGDLDTIVLKALRVEPDRRYPSVAALVDDLGRHLGGLPVTARPDSLRYRAEKFVQRHRVPVAAAAAALLVLVGATVVSLRFAVAADRQRLEAERQTAIATAVNEFLNDDLLAKADPYVQPDPDLTLRHALDLAAGAAGERFGERPLVEAGIRMTLGKAYEGLGALEESANHYRRAFDLRQTHLGPEHEQTLRAQLGRLFGLYNAGHNEEALPQVDRLVEQCRRVLGSDHQVTAQALKLKAVVYGLARDHQAEIEILEETAGVHRRAFGDEHPETLAVLNDLAISYDNLGRYDEALALYEEVLSVGERVLPEGGPAIALIRISLGSNSMYRGDLDDAERVFAGELVKMEPTLGEEHPLYTVTLGLLGRVYRRQGDLDKALEVALRTLELQARTLPPESQLFRRGRINVMNLYSQTGRHEEAIAIARELLREQQELGGGLVRVSQARLANVLRAAGRCVEALAVVRGADPDREEPQFHQDTGFLLAVRGLCAFEGGRPVAARPDLERAFALLLPLVGLDPTVEAVSDALLEVFERTGDAAAAVAHRDRLASSSASGSG